MTVDSSEDTEPVSYTSAVAELESILLQLEDDDVDIDALTSQVQRAAELINLCRQRIHSAKIQVEQVVTGLETGDDGNSTQPETEDA